MIIFGFFQDDDHDCELDLEDLLNFDTDSERRQYALVSTNPVLHKKSTAYFIYIKIYIILPLTLQGRVEGGEQLISKRGENKTKLEINALLRELAYFTFYEQKKLGKYDKNCVVVLNMIRICFPFFFKFLFIYIFFFY